MKNRRWLGLLAAAMALTGHARAQDAPAAEMVEFQVRFVEATTKQIFDILNAGPGSEIPSLTGDPIPPFSPPTPVPDTPAGVRLGGFLTPKQTTSFFKALKEQKISVSPAQRATTLIGRMARVQNVKEFRYPTSFSKPTKQEDSVPKEFETVPLGITMEIEPMKEQVEVIDIKLYTRIWKLTGFVEEKADTAKTDTAAPPWQPTFKISETTTEASVFSGGTMVFCTTGNGDGAKEDFIFITARKISSP